MSGPPAVVVFEELFLVVLTNDRANPLKMPLFHCSLRFSFYVSCYRLFPLPLLPDPCSLLPALFSLFSSHCSCSHAIIFP